MANKLVCIFGAIGLTFAILCFLACGFTQIAWPGCKPGPYNNLDRYHPNGERMITAAMVLIFISMLLAITCIILFPIAWCYCEKRVCMMVSLLIITAHLTIFLLYNLIAIGLWYNSSDVCSSPEGPLAMSILAFLFATNCEVCAVLLMAFACECC